MKKSLVALAALAVVGAASAQSSVTLYGVVDAALFDSNAAGVDAQMSGSGLMNNGTSRLGFRGSEDLGGGMKAGFNIEGGFNPETGVSNLSGGNMYSRAANLSLSGNFGSVRLGRGLTPSFYGVYAWELTNTANYSVVANQFGFAGADPRNSSEFSYTTPSMSGFSATLGYVAKSDNIVGATPGTFTPAGVFVPAVTGVAASKTDANVLYVNGPIAVGLSYNKIQGFERGLALGAKYDFGTFVLAGSLQDPAGAKKGFTIGGTANLGPVALTLDLARDTGSAVKNTDTLLEAKYALSKRTFTYAAVLRDGSAVATLPSVTSYSLGIRHNF